ncbi:MAG: flagellar biosynthetic protein FliQ [Lachnospiraceae bacterium]|nr:flagellar biosynthetic protein FliQ [Lachnospiraceae bacterium]
MDTAVVLDVMYQTFQLLLKTALPFLLVSMTVGIVIAIFQAATQISEQTLTFVPKLLVIIVLLGILGSSMMAELQGFFIQILEMIAGG